jgi:hypothetical protein
MPNLIKSAYNGYTNEPIVWRCSACDKAFSPERIEYTTEEIHKMNREYQQHCAEAHPGEPAVGVEL